MTAPRPHTLPLAAEPQPELPLDRSVGYQIRKTHRLVQRALQARIEPHGVSLGMWYFLRVLWNGDGLTQSELSAEIGTMEPTTLSAVASMEQAGLVRRERHSTDGRKVRVFLTEKGHALRKDLLPEGVAVVSSAIRSFSDTELDLLLRLLKAMQADLVQELDARPPVARRPRGGD